MVASFHRRRRRTIIIDYNHSLFPAGEEEEVEYSRSLFLSEDEGSI